MFERLRADYNSALADSYVKSFLKCISKYSKSGREEYRLSAIQFGRKAIKRFNRSIDLFWGVNGVTRDDALKFEREVSGEIFFVKDILYDLVYHYVPPR